MPGKALGDGPGTWAPAAHVGDQSGPALAIAALWRMNWRWQISLLPPFLSGGLPFLHTHTHIWRSAKPWTNSRPGARGEGRQGDDFISSQWAPDSFLPERPKTGRAHRVCERALRLWFLSAQGLRQESRYPPALTATLCSAGTERAGCKPLKEDRIPERWAVWP